jgi:hypothetical protein
MVREAGFFERVGKRIVANVVEKGGESDTNSLVGGDELGHAALIECGECASSEVIGAQRMLEARVRRAGIDQIRIAELPHIPQTLDCRGVQHRQRIAIHSDVVPERIANDLEIHG